jgi:HD superfamily phosphohydrolase YqeK
MEEYFAHSENDDGEWELLQIHLRKTEKLARKYASVFDESHAASWAAILHDIGKASLLFQGVLKKIEHNIDICSQHSNLSDLIQQLAICIHCDREGLH